jgi:hypothetical protein
MAYHCHCVEWVLLSNYLFLCLQFITSYYGRFLPLLLVGVAPLGVFVGVAPLNVLGVALLSVSPRCINWFGACGKGPPRLQ